jgi:phosphatidylglycerophosphatase A
MNEDPQDNFRSKLKLSDPVHLIAVGFGSGLAKKAPGTMGTLAALPIVAVMNLMPIPWYILWTLLFFLLGIYVCGKTARDLEIHDHPGLVWDEFVGLMFSCIALPSGWFWLFVAFVLFRAFDIFKPYPINLIDTHMKGGLGIMLDDLVAGAMTFISVQTLYGIWSWIQ